MDPEYKVDYITRNYKKVRKSNSVGPADSKKPLEKKRKRKTKRLHPCIQNLGMAATFLLPLAIVASTVGLLTNFWFVIGADNVGLLKFCNNYSKECFDISGKIDNVTTMETAWTYGKYVDIAGVAATGLGFLLLLCFPCHNKVNCSKRACGTVIAFIVMLGTFSLMACVGLMVYFHLVTSDKVYQLNWSLYTAAGGAGLALVATVLFWTHIMYICCYQ